MVNACIGLILFFSIVKTGYSTHQCNRTFEGTSTLRFRCSPTLTDFQLNLYDLTTNQLDSITNLVVIGGEGTESGSFPYLPPNLCLLRNLESINFSNNRITEVDPPNALISCLPRMRTINLRSNQIEAFPSRFTRSMVNLTTIDFSRNQLRNAPRRAFFNPANLDVVDLSVNNLRTWELWTLLVRNRVDLSNNRIGTISNDDFLDMPYNSTSERTILLTGNAIDGPLDLSDAVYPMYNACDELAGALDPTTIPPGSAPPMISFALAFTYFGTTRLNCGCNQYYIGRGVSSTVGGPDVSFGIPLYNATCADGTRFRDNPCLSDSVNWTSSVNFNLITPRLCYISQNETGELTVPNNNTETPLNASARPYYETRWMSPGVCFFSFTSLTDMSLRCNIETIPDSIRLPQDFLESSYMATVTRVQALERFSQVVPYLCDLPSRVIDLSGQMFTTLSSTTFSCLDNFRSVNLAANQITSVNIPTTTLQNLNKIDLSSNQLTEVPRVFFQTNSSLNTVDLRNNSIRNIDLIIFSRRNVAVLLDGNPINSSAFINPSNIVFPVGATASNLTFPSSVRTSTLIINDNLMATALACTINQMNSLIVAMREIYANVQLDCTCASIYIKTIYQNNSRNITSELGCSMATATDTYYRLTLRNCSTTEYFLSRCPQSNSPTNGGAQSSTSNDSGSTGLIVGLVVGLGGSLILIIIIVAVIYMMKGKKSNNSESGAIRRAKLTGTANDHLGSRAQAQQRNPRSVKLDPIKKKISKLPPVPVSTITTGSGNTNRVEKSNLSRGQREATTQYQANTIRSPTQIETDYDKSIQAAERSSAFRTIENPNNQGMSRDSSTRGQSLRKHEMLNTGGQTYFS